MPNPERPDRLANIEATVTDLRNGLFFVLLLLIALLALAIAQ